MKNLKIILIIAGALGSSIVHSLPFTKLVGQRFLQSQAWQRASQFSSTHASKIKQLVKHTDKIVSSGYLLYKFPFFMDKTAYLNSFPQLPEDKQPLIENSCSKIGVNFSDIDIKMCPNLDNAFVSFKPLNKHILVVGEKLLERPIEQQKAVLAHELAHVKHNHALQRELTPFGVSLLTATGCLLTKNALVQCFKLLQKAPQTNNLLKLAKGALSIPLSSVSLQSYALWKQAIGGGTTTKFEYDNDGNLIKEITTEHKKTFEGFGYQLIPRLARYQEKQADITAVKLADTAQGAIDYFQAFIDPTEPDTIKTNPLAGHPCPQERINYLKPYVTQRK